MNRRSIIYIIFVAIIIAMGILIYSTYIHLDTKRIKLADNMYNEAVHELNPQTRLIYLIESNFLLKTESKNLMIVESAFESNNQSIADLYSKNIYNQDILKELSVFNDFSKGNYESALLLPTEPLTNLGKLVKYIYEDDTELNSYKSAYLLNIKEIYKNEKNQAEADVAKLFLKYNQPYLSIYMLNKIAKEHKCSSMIYKDLAINFEMLGIYDQSLENIEKAIECNPVDKNLYVLAKNYARLLDNAAKENLYTNKLEYLDIISN